MTDLLKKLKESDKNLFVGVAGPGTGKSTAFKTIVESDGYKGKNILILSFINKLVDDLLADFINFPNVRVLTLHAFAKQEMEKRIKEVDLDQDLDDIISEDFLYLKGTANDFQQKFYEDDLDEEDAKFYLQRKDFYREKLYSFNSIIYAFNRLFNKFKEKIPKFDLILIDEFQDFNKLEVELIRLLNTKNKVVLVGDDFQSLYDFKNARPEQIISLYKDDRIEKFSFDYCYRCPEVIVEAANNLISNAKNKGYLKDRMDKKFLYPKEDEKHKSKHELSLRYPKIDFISSVQGSLLIDKISRNIKDHISERKGKRILIIAPNYLKQTLYDGLIEKGFNIVDFELFCGEKCNGKKHKYLIGAFNILIQKKTDNLALRKILFLYLEENGIKDLLCKEMQIWPHLDAEVKLKIEKDIQIFKKVRIGKKKLSEEELKRFQEIFSIKNVLSKFIKGFKPIQKGAIEIELVTVMCSKGLSGDIVYYIGVDDKIMIDDKLKDFTNQKLCEFLVGITRTKEKLTLISLEDQSPKILDFIDKKYINNLN